ncbi:hypothetical protein Tco_0212761 [Tanacetum coccineum]
MKKDERKTKGIVSTPANASNEKQNGSYVLFLNRNCPRTGPSLPAKSAKSANARSVEAHPRTLNKKNRVDSNLLVKHSVSVSKLNNVCAACNKSLVFANHTDCWLCESKPQWQPTGRHFSLFEKYPFTRIMEPTDIPIELPQCSFYGPPNNYGLKVIQTYLVIERQVFPKDLCDHWPRRFVNGGLEKCFPTASCHIRNYDMVRLYRLTVNGQSNQYSISLNDMIQLHQFSLLIRRSPSTKSWLCLDASNSKKAITSTKTEKHHTDSSPYTTTWTSATNWNWKNYHWKRSTPSVWISEHPNQVTTMNAGKLKAKADKVDLCGYAPHPEGVRIYNKRTRKILKTVHVAFE